MNKSKAVILICVILYFLFFMTVVDSVLDKYGDNSIQLLFVVIVLGPVIVVLIASHKGINDWLNKIS